MFRRVTLIFSILLVVVAFLEVAHATSLALTITTDKEIYDPGENVTLSGNLTLNGSPVSDGLVSIQVDYPKGYPFIVRTLPTGGTPTGPWPIELLGVAPCDSAGNPQSSFTRGRTAYFNVTVRNNGLNSLYVIVTLTLYYYDSSSFNTTSFYNRTIEGGDTEWLVQGVPIPSNALLGTATAYANAFNDWPKNNGFAWCPEKSATFTITSGGTLSTATSLSQEVYTSLTPGFFNTVFKTFTYGGILGNYTIYATSHYQIWFISNQKKFELILIADVNKDGKVDMVDIWLVAKAFGSYPGYENWNPDADIDKDGKVDMVDMWLVSKDFGKTGGY